MGDPTACPARAAGRRPVVPAVDGSVKSVNTRTDTAPTAVTDTVTAPVARLWIAAFCGYLSLGAAFQALPAFSTSRFGAGPALVGVIVAVASLATALVRPTAGRLADQGRARTSILCGAACGVLGGLGHLWSPDVPVLIVARLLLGAGEGAVFSAAIGWAIRGFPADRRGTLAGWFGLSMWGGLSMGPLLAVLLHSAGGERAVWLGVAGMPAVTFLLAASTRSGGEAGRGPTRRVSGGGARRRKRDRIADGLPGHARLPGVLFGLASFGYGAVAALVLLRLKDSGLGGQSLALPTFAVAFLLVRVCGSPLVTRLEPVVTAVGCMLVEAVGLAMIGVFDSVGGVLAGIAVTAAGLGVLYPAMVAIVVRRGSAASNGAAVAVLTSFWDLGIVLAGPVGGALAGTAGFTTAFVLAGVLSAAAAFGTLSLPRGHPPEQPQA
jgi:MFS family permease